MDPLQIGIIEKMPTSEGNGKVKIRAMMRPENITEDPVEVCKSGINRIKKKSFQDCGTVVVSLCAQTVERIF